MAIVGSICFGLVIGWVTYRTLRRNAESVQLSDIATVIGAVGGAAVTTVFADPDLFGGYCIGLAVGFFAYFIVGLFVKEENAAGRWMTGG
ncbi:hypothetical protein [Pseudonocardia lacus]|uniref:hypothetical protein n=1 Tax=Pseudonocardia lacus TaxID=2835865 RepID=UPI001BDD56C5|nr:hypothetical protein [Pseudonocardia lacus]